MLIKPFRKYVVLCKGPDQKTYRWHLNVKPGYKAWKIVNENVQVGDKFKGYLILSINDITNEFEFALNQTEMDYQDDEDDFEFWEKPISKDEFDFAVSQFDLEFAVRPFYSQSYRCQICGGVVVNDICTDCMFDWGS
ncbi:hypothetical protein [Geobacillus stearothermophilus]|uniref:hypothetical protein n=1 Tax=Geobacillus stearothermophilus TaxID=1422 RepID=UPI003D1E656A